jgi:hypothetical protein
MYGSTRLLATGCCLAMVLLGCTDDAGTGPLDPEFAKGGNKGKPGEGGGDAVLQEYWVIPGLTVSDPDQIHVVWSGNGSSVNPSVVWDHFFDGIRDDDPPVDQHYEFYYTGPPNTPGASLPNEPNGTMHVDIPWDGRRRSAGAFYPDYLATEVPGEGDPFAFALTFFNGSTRVSGTIPFGVVINGVNDFGNVDPEATVAGVVHASASVRSYATFKGGPAAGVMFVDALSLDGSSLACVLKTVTTGRGRNKIRTTKAVVSGNVTVQFDRYPAITLENGEYVWAEGHFLDVNAGDVSTRTGSFGSGSYSFSETMPDGWSGGEVEFIVDYLVPSSTPNPEANDPNHPIFSNYVYDPARNGVPTTAGFGGEGWSNGAPSASVNDGRFPVAHSAGSPVSCR